MIVYCDMCGDLFHYGHVNYLKKAKELGDYLLVGVHNDDTIRSYKRNPIMTMEERICVIDACKYVDGIIPNAPLEITEEYLNKHKIDIMVLPDNRTEEERELWYSHLIKQGKIVTLPSTPEISTTEIIKRISKV